MEERQWLTGRGGLVASVALALAGVAALALAAGGPDPRRPAEPVGAAETLPMDPTGRLAPSTPPLAANLDRVRGPLLPNAEPLSLRIARIGVETELVDLGLDFAGEMETPADPAFAGWYTAAPPPGALGPAVLAGHVTWGGEPAVFFRLGELAGGDRVEVRRADGRTAVFEVSRVARFAKSKFPTHAVYGATDHAALRLITCGGRYDEDRASYDDNIVVFATLVAVRRS